MEENNQIYRSDATLEQKRELIFTNFKKASALSQEITSTPSKAIPLISSTPLQEPLQVKEPSTLEWDETFNNLYHDVTTVSLDEIPSIINKYITPDNSNYNRYINMLKIAIYKEMTELCDLAYEGNSTIDEDFNEFYEGLNQILQAIDGIEETEDLIASSQNTKNTLFFKTSLNRVVIFEEIDKDIPTDMYPQVLELIEGLINGEFKNLKFLRNRRVFEMRLDQLRLTFARLSNNKLLVLDCFVKKVFTSHSYREKMSRMSSQYLGEKDEYLAKVDDPDFIKEHQKYLDEIIELCKNKGRRLQ